MQTQNKVLLTLLLLPSLIAELLSGSSPPLEFLNPLSFLFWGLLYGCGTLLIREARVRWNMQWSVIFLVIAYGIIEEGLTTKALFNINWVDVAVYSNYGTIAGVLVPWSIMLLTFHAVISTLIPILIIDLTWPKYKKVSVIGKKGLGLVFLGLSLIVFFGLKFMGTIINNQMIPYYPNLILLFGSLFLVLFLIFLGYKFRNSQFVSTNNIFKPKIFAIFSFFFMILFMNVPYELAKNNVNQFGLIFYQLFLVLILLIFTFYQIYNKNITNDHFISIVFGSLFFWCIFAILLEFQGFLGMSIIGVLAFFILIKWKRNIV